MKAAAIAICCVLLMAMGWPESVEVEGAPQESSAPVRIAVVMQGKPATGVKVDFYPYGTQQAAFEAQSDENGFVVTPKLAMRDYNVVATLDNNVQTFLWLRVVRKHAAHVFSMDLTGSYYKAHPELGLEAYRGTEEPVHDRIQAFEGTVLDIAGAAVSETKIRVLKMGAQGKDFMLALHPDANGHFASPLPEGRYIAFFFANGFRTAKVSFEITRAGDGELKVALEPGRSYLGNKCPNTLIP
jgi:hypothetical protein